MKILDWIHRLFAAPTCPGCGREIVEWTDKWVRNGYREERRWRGCPVYRDWRPLDRESDRHSAHWSSVKRTPLRDEEP